ncbi:MAG TPA: HDOD domain-containing protein [Thauera sp.]|nr:HDOD domain-containing protein [Thauera sp.]
MHSAQELASQIESLTSLPTVYDRVREQLDSPHGSVFEVARLVSADPALTARLLRLVNSAMYGYRGEVDSVMRAVQILGLQQLHDLVLAMSLHAVFAGIRPAQLDMNQFWRDSVLCALAARGIAQNIGRPGLERVSVIGLLADIGHLVLYQTTPELADEARQSAAQTGEALHLAEQRIIGCDFAEVGAALMDQWRVPSSFAGAIGTQTRPRLGGDHAIDAAILNLARHIVDADARGESSKETVARVEPSVWDLLDIAPDSIAAIREEAELNLAAYLSVFFPPRTH